MDRGAKGVKAWTRGVGSVNGTLNPGRYHQRSWPWLSCCLKEFSLWHKEFFVMKYFLGVFEDRIVSLGLFGVMWFQHCWSSSLRLIPVRVPLQLQLLSTQLLSQTWHTRSTVHDPYTIQGIKAAYELHILTFVDSTITSSHRPQRPALPAWFSHI